MKKLLQILGVLTISAVPISSVVSCVIPDEEIPKNDDQLFDFLNIKRENIMINSQTNKSDIQRYFEDQINRNETLKGKFVFEALDYDVNKNTGFFMFSLTQDISKIGVEGQDFSFIFTTVEVPGKDVLGQSQLGTFNFRSDIRVDFGAKEDEIKKNIQEQLNNTKYFENKTSIEGITYEKFDKNGECNLEFTNDVDLAYKKGDTFNFHYQLNWNNNQNANPSTQILDTNLDEIVVRSDRNALTDIKEQITNTLNSNARLKNKWKYYNQDDARYWNFDRGSNTGNFILEFTSKIDNYFSEHEYKNMKFIVLEKDVSDLNNPTTDFFDCDFSYLIFKPTDREEAVKKELIRILNNSNMLAGKYKFLDDKFNFNKDFNGLISHQIEFQIEATSDVDITFEKGDVKHLAYTFSFEGVREIKVDNIIRYNFIIDVFKEEIADILKDKSITVGDFKNRLNDLIYQTRSFNVEFGKDADIQLATDLGEVGDSTPISSLKEIRIYGFTQKVLGDYTFEIS